jgi:hypothetical protein
MCYDILCAACPSSCLLGLLPFSQKQTRKIKSERLLLQGFARSCISPFFSKRKEIWTSSGPRFIVENIYFSAFTIVAPTLTPIPCRRPSTPSARHPPGFFSRSIVNHLLARSLCVYPLHGHWQPHGVAIVSSLRTLCTARDSIQLMLHDGNWYCCAGTKGRILITKVSWMDKSMLTSFFCLIEFRNFALF